MGIASDLSHDDPIVQEVLDIWTPRFLGGGIAIGDLAATVARMKSWDDWAREWMATAYVHEARGDGLAARGHLESASDAWLLASRCFHLAYFVSTRDTDLHDQGLTRMLECHDRALPHLKPAVEKVEFGSGASRWVGLLSVPASRGGPHPIVILLPGLDSTKETRHSGRGRWLGRDVAVLSMDGPGQGEASRWSVVRHDYEVAVTAAIDWIATRPDLDDRAIGLVGASLAGYYAPRAAAFEPRVRATVANCGPFDWGACWDGLPVVTREAFAHYSGTHDPGAARERAGAFTLEGVARQVDSPLLVFHGQLDPLIPWQQGERIARESGGEFVLVEGGNHGLNNLPYTWMPRAVDWMCAHLGA